MNRGRVAAVYTHLGLSLSACLLSPLALPSAALVISAAFFCAAACREAAFFSAAALIFSLEAVASATVMARVGIRVGVGGKGEGQC